MTDEQNKSSETQSPSAAHAPARNVPEGEPWWYERVPLATWRAWICRGGAWDVSRSAETGRLRWAPVRGGAYVESALGGVGAGLPADAARVGSSMEIENVQEVRDPRAAVAGILTGAGIKYDEGHLAALAPRVALDYAVERVEAHIAVQGLREHRDAVERAHVDGLEEAAGILGHALQEGHSIDAEARGQLWRRTLRKYAETHYSRGTGYLVDDTNRNTALMIASAIPGAPDLQGEIKNAPFADVVGIVQREIDACVECARAEGCIDGLVEAAGILGWAQQKNHCMTVEEQRRYWHDVIREHKESHYTKGDLGVLQRTTAQTIAQAIPGAPNVDREIWDAPAADAASIVIREIGAYAEREAAARRDMLRALLDRCEVPCTDDDLAVEDADLVEAAAARVVTVRETWRKETGEYKRFEILHSVRDALGLPFVEGQSWQESLDRVLDMIRAVRASAEAVADHVGPVTVLRTEQQALERGRAEGLAEACRILGIPALRRDGEGLDAAYVIDGAREKLAQFARNIPDGHVAARNINAAAAAARRTALADACKCLGISEAPATADECMAALERYAEEQRAKPAQLANQVADVRAQVTTEAGEDLAYFEGRAYGLAEACEILDIPAVRRGGEGLDAGYVIGGARTKLAQLAKQVADDHAAARVEGMRQACRKLGINDRDLSGAFECMAALERYAKDRRAKLLDEARATAAGILARAGIEYDAAHLTALAPMQAIDYAVERVEAHITAQVQGTSEADIMDNTSAAVTAERRNALADVCEALGIREAPESADECIALIRKFGQNTAPEQVREQHYLHGLRVALDLFWPFNDAALRAGLNPSPASSSAAFMDLVTLRDRVNDKLVQGRMQREEKIVTARNAVNDLLYDLGLNRAREVLDAGTVGAVVACGVRAVREQARERMEHARGSGLLDGSYTTALRILNGLGVEPPPAATDIEDPEARAKEEARRAAEAVENYFRVQKLRLAGEAGYDENHFRRGVQACATAIGVDIGANTSSSDAVAIIARWAAQHGEKEARSRRVLADLLRELDLADACNETLNAETVAEAIGCVARAVRKASRDASKDTLATGFRNGVWQCANAIGLDIGSHVSTDDAIQILGKHVKDCIALRDYRLVREGRLHGLREALGFLTHEAPFACGAHGPIDTLDAARAALEVFREAMRTSTEKVRASASAGGAREVAVSALSSLGAYDEATGEALRKAEALGFPHVAAVLAGRVRDLIDELRASYEQSGADEPAAWARIIAEARETPAPLAPDVQTFDPVERPSHYASGGIECIDAIEAALQGDTDATSAFLRGQVIKYIWRMHGKGAPLQDARKAEWYLRRLIARLSGPGEPPTRHDELLRSVAEQERRMRDGLRGEVRAATSNGSVEIFMYAPNSDAINADIEAQKRREKDEIIQDLRCQLDDAWRVADNLYDECTGYRRTDVEREADRKVHARRITAPEAEAIRGWMARRAGTEPQPAPPRDARQADVHAWCARAFGALHATNLEQRAVRFLEEALELFQAAGGGAEMAMRLIARVFGNPSGELAQELGGAGVTLLALASAAGLSADAEERRETERVLAIPDEVWAQRLAAKRAEGLDVIADDARPERDRAAIYEAAMKRSAEIKAGIARDARTIRTFDAWRETDDARTAIRATDARAAALRYCAETGVDWDDVKEMTVHVQETDTGVVFCFLAQQGADGAAEVQQVIK